MSSIGRDGRSRYEQRSKRKRVALAGPSLLARAPDGTELRLTSGEMRRRLRRIKRSVVPMADPDSGVVYQPTMALPGRFVCDMFAGRRQIDAVLGCSQHCAWWSSPHSFETVPIATFSKNVAHLPGGPAAVTATRQLRNAARECVCEALEVDQVLYHAHATITRTRSPTALPQLSDDDALQLFGAIALKDSANAEYRRGMYDSAIRMYTQALEKLPDALRTTHAEAAIILNNRAAAYNQQQDFRSVSLLAAVYKSPGIHTFFCFAVTHLMLMRICHAQVISDATAALTIAPANIKALMRRGFAFEAMERYPDALADMETVGRLAPRTREAVRAAGRLRGLVKAWDKIQAQEEEERDTMARPPSLDSWETSASQSPGASHGHEGQLQDGSMQFNGIHADMASVVHYDYSAVVYLTSSATAIAATTDSKGGFSGGSFVFCDGDADRTVVAREGRLVGFSSGLENGMPNNSCAAHFNLAWLDDFHNIKIKIIIVAPDAMMTTRSQRIG